MKSKKIKWLALAVMIMVVMEACNSEDNPTLPLSQVIIGTWQPKSYISDHLLGWRDINDSNGLTEISITNDAIIITQYGRYDETAYLTYELEIASFENDTIRTGSWKTDPWKALEPNERLFRRDETDNDNSVWIQCGVHHIILEKKTVD